MFPIGLGGAAMANAIRNAQQGQDRRYERAIKVATDIRRNDPHRSPPTTRPLPKRGKGDIQPDNHAGRVEQPVRARVRFSLELLFILCGYAVGSLLALMSLMDLCVGVPFYKASVLFDSGLLFASTILLYLSYDAQDGCTA